METNEPRLFPFSIRYGIVAGLLLIIFFLLQQFLELYSGIAGFVPVLLLAGVIIWAFREFKGQNSGFMSYGQGLGIGAFTGLISGAVSGLFTYLYIKFYDPELMQRMADIQRAEMEKQGNLTDEQIEQAMEMAQRFSNPELTMLFTPLWNLILGFIIALVVAAAMRNARPEFE